MDLKKFNPSSRRFDSDKRLKLEQDTAEKRNSKYKGVTPINGQWRAQIYKQGRRICLGTFQSELDAAKAYDTVSLMFHNNNSYRNVHSTVDDNIQEKIFQSKHSVHQVVEMIKQGSYNALKFDYFQRQRLDSNLVVIHDGEYSTQLLLFDKVLTSSDVGTLSRFAIPKRSAELYLPPMDSNGNAQISLDIDFYDTQKNMWTFCYCFRKSNKSYVFSRGWNRFVKEKGLKAGYTVSFYMNKGPGGNFYGIQVADVGREKIVGTVTQNLNTSEEIKNIEAVTVKEEDESSKASSNARGKGFMLFGAHIKSTPLLPQGERSIDVDGRVGENEDYSAQTTNYQKRKFGGLDLDLKLSF